MYVLYRYRYILARRHISYTLVWNRTVSWSSRFQRISTRSFTCCRGKRALVVRVTGTYPHPYSTLFYPNLSEPTPYYSDMCGAHYTVTFKRDGGDGVYVETKKEAVSFMLCSAQPHNEPIVQVHNLPLNLPQGCLISRVPCVTYLPAIT